MYSNPHTHLAIAREREADLLREARKRELARSVASERPSLLSRVRARFGERGAGQPVARPA
jgi:hypothetical protein